MKRAFCYIGGLLLTLNVVLPVQGQDFVAGSEGEIGANHSLNDFDASRPKIFSGTKSFGRINSCDAVKQYLMIEYPWSKIKNSTLEVRILGPEAEKQAQFCKPVYFKKVYGNLERIEKDVFNKIVGDPHFTNDIEYKRSLFHEYGLPEPESCELATIKPVAGARADYFHVVLKNPDTNELETTLVFHELSQWSVDSERLALELIGKPITDADGKRIKEIEFEKPCKIKIWLLHDDYIVWEETFQWPGEKKAKSGKSDNNKQVSSKADDDEDPREMAKNMEKSNLNQKKEDSQPEDEAEEDADFDDFGDDF